MDRRTTTATAIQSVLKATEPTDDLIRSHSTDHDKTDLDGYNPDTASYVSYCSVEFAEYVRHSQDKNIFDVLNVPICLIAETLCSSLDGRYFGRVSWLVSV